MAFHSGSCQGIRLWNERGSFCTSSSSSMASNRIILPDSFSFQRGLQQALGDPANSCREEEEADMILLISQSVHTIFVQSFAAQLRNTFKFILYI